MTKHVENAVTETLDIGLLKSILTQHNLAVWNAASTSWKQIPVALNPVVVKRTTWTQVVDDARMVLSSFPVLLSWLQRSEQKVLFDMLFGGLEGAEKEIAAQDPKKYWGHITMRFDLFWQEEEIKIIEANCTIPAMQAYSDMVLDAWLKASGHVANPPSNSTDLLQSLLTLYKRDGGYKDKPTIAILHRAGDSQIAELQYHAKQWSKVTRVVLTTPEELKATAKGWSIGEEPIDVIYRHIFGWRLRDRSDLLNGLREYSSNHIYNPLSAHYEVKGFLALLSSVAVSDKISRDVGLSNEQRDAINRRVPWTRIVETSMHGIQLDGTALDAELFSKQIDMLVVKNSLGYGGGQVFVGSEWNSEDVQGRLKKLLNLGSSVTPQMFWQWMSEHPSDVWIVQQRVSGRRHQTPVLTSEGQIIETFGYVDASVFLNTGGPAMCGGGVSRFAPGPVVNIGMGGGLAPFLVVD